MRFGAGVAKAALPFTATRIAKMPAISRTLTATATEGSIGPSGERAGAGSPESRVVSRTTAMIIAAAQPATTLHASLRIFVDPAVAKRKITPMPAATT